MNTRKTDFILEAKSNHYIKRIDPFDKCFWVTPGILEAASFSTIEDAIINMRCVTIPLTIKQRVINISIIECNTLYDLANKV